MDPIDRLPDTTLLHIFRHLGARDLVRASETCRRWSRVARDEHLWRHRFAIDFSTGSPSITSTTLPIDGECWLAEYARLKDECPRGERARFRLQQPAGDSGAAAEAAAGESVRGSSSRRVLHASFSHDGSMLITCTDDAVLNLYAVRSSGGADDAQKWELIHEKNMRQLLYWKRTLCARFNPSDRLIMVCGTRAGESSSSMPPQANGVGAVAANQQQQQNGLGELAVFELVRKSSPPKDPATAANLPNGSSSPSTTDLVFRCRAINEPYDAFGYWYDDESILNAQSRRFNQNSTMSDLYFLHAASEQTTSTRLFQFYNPHGGVVRNLLVSSCRWGSGGDEDEEAEQGSPLKDLPIMHDKDKILIFTTGRRLDTPHQIGLKVIRHERVTGPLVAAAKSMNKRNGAAGGGPKLPSYRKIQGIKKIEVETKGEEKTKEVSTASSGQATESTPSKPDAPSTNSEALAGASATTEESPSASTAPSSGSAVTSEVPGTSASTLVASPQTNDPMDRPGEAAAKNLETPSTSGQEASQAPRVEESDDEDSDEEAAAYPAQQVQIRVHTFDRVDHTIEMDGRILGTSLSPDQRYLFVHVRLFVDPGSVAEIPSDQPIPVHHDHTWIRVIDLCTLRFSEADSFPIPSGELAAMPPPTDPPTADPSHAFASEPDVTDRYVSIVDRRSNLVHIYDRWHRCRIGSIDHNGGGTTDPSDGSARVSSVNSASFDPCDPNICATTGDDGSTNIWYSKAKWRTVPE